MRPTTSRGLGMGLLSLCTLVTLLQSLGAEETSPERLVVAALCQALPARCPLGTGQTTADDLGTLAGLLLMRNDADYRGWLMIAAALALGFAWSLTIDAVLKPAIVVVIYLWLAWTMAAPARWREIVEGEASEQVSPGEHAVAGVVAGNR